MPGPPTSTKRMRRRSIQSPCPSRPRSRRWRFTRKIALKGGDDAQQFDPHRHARRRPAARPDRRRQVRGRRRQGRPRHHRRPRHPARQRQPPRSPSPTATRSVKVPVKRRGGATRTCRSTSPTRSCRSSPSSAATRGGCHGKASGQNGFKLSLLGFEPEVDYDALVKEARGRRLFPAAPDHSLLLLKATGKVAHGGGKRMEVGSDEYKLVRRWIAAGTPVRQAGRPGRHQDHRLSRSTAS